MSWKPKRRYLRRLVLPIVLLGAAIGYWLVAAQMGTTSVAPPVAVETVPVDVPLVSIDRLPAFTADVIAQDQLAQALASLPDVPDGLVCAHVLIDGEAVVDVSSETLLSPSYAQMSITAFAAIDRLGPEFRFETELMSSANPDDQGRLAGGLFVVGGGDPVIMSRAYAQRLRPVPATRTAVVDIVGALAETGITGIAGGVVGVDARYDDERVISGWPNRLVESGVVGQLGALQINDGVSATAAIPGDETSVVPSPAAHGAELLVAALNDFGIEVVGGSRASTADDDLANLVPIAVVESAPLSEIVHQTVATNDATAVELLLKELGFASEGVGSTQAGSRSVQALLTSAGVDVVVPFRDGSGLGPLGGTSCSHLTATMELMQNGHPALAALPGHDESAAFAGLFPDVEVEADLRFVGGADGDARGFVAGTVDGPGARITVASIVNRSGGPTEQDALFQQALVEVVDELQSWVTVEVRDD